MVFQKCVLISSNRSNSSVFNLEFTPCITHVLHFVRQVLERGVWHLSLKIGRGAKKYGRDAALKQFQIFLENIMHIHYRVLKIVCSIGLFSN
jgi:hypothetical protein